MVSSVAWALELEAFRPAERRDGIFLLLSSRSTQPLLSALSLRSELLACHRSPASELLSYSSSGWCALTLGEEKLQSLLMGIIDWFKRAIQGNPLSPPPLRFKGAFKALPPKANS